MATLTKAANQPLQLNEVQAFFGRLFTHQNGFALTNLGRIHQTSRLAMPENNANVLLQPTWTYTPGTVPQGDGTMFPSIVGQVREPVARDYSGARLDVDVTIHSVPSDGLGALMRMSVSTFDADNNTLNTTLFLAQDETNYGQGTGVILTPGDYTLTADSTQGSTNVPANGYLGFAVFLEAVADRDLEYTIHGIRVSFDSTPLEAQGRFPDTGGFALTRLGSASENGASSWPNNQGWVEGVDITYTPTDISLGTIAEVAGVITNNGPAVDLTNARVDIDFTITSITSSPSNIIPSILIRKNSISAFNATTGTALGLGRHTLTDLSLSVAVPQANRMWQTGEDIDIYLNETGDDFTYTIDAVRFSFTQTEFIRSVITENLSNYNLGGRIVPTGPLVYPTTGGIAIDNLGEGTLNSGDFYTWPIVRPDIQGQTGFRYFQGAGSGTTFTDGRFVNETGSNIILTNLRVDIRITFTAIPSSATFQPFLWLNTGGTLQNPTPSSVEFIQMNLANMENVPQVYTFTNMQGTWVNNQNLYFRIFTNNSAETPFTYRIDHVRMNLVNEATEFVSNPTINGDVPTESTQVTLNSLRGVDDGVE